MAVSSGRILLGLMPYWPTFRYRRGLTSSKLALPAIGGTINYITKSIENKESVFVQQSYGSFNTFRTSMGYNSGRLKNGWGYSIAGSFRVGDGFYEQQFR